MVSRRAAAPKVSALVLHALAVIEAGRVIGALVTAVALKAGLAMAHGFPGIWIDATFVVIAFTAIRALDFASFAFEAFSTAAFQRFAKRKAHAAILAKSGTNVMVAKFAIVHWVNAIAKWFTRNLVNFALAPVTIKVFAGVLYLSAENVNKIGM